LPLSYFAFWTVRLGGWLPRFDRCSACAEVFGSADAFYSPWEPGLFCDKCRRPGMRPLHLAGRLLAETFASQRLDRIADAAALLPAARELREAALDWIEHHTERRLNTRKLLEMT
jgi:recombinational DNA repair protein (RecF pathway)